MVRIYKNNEKESQRIIGTLTRLNRVVGSGKLGTLSLSWFVFANTCDSKTLNIAVAG